jgi:hypothetical protein
MDGHGKSAGARAPVRVCGATYLEFYFTRCATFWPVPWGFDF